MKSVQKLMVVLIYHRDSVAEEVSKIVSTKKEGLNLAYRERKNGCVGCYFGVVHGFEDEDGVEYTQNYFSKENFFFGKKVTFAELESENEKLGHGEYDTMLIGMALLQSEAVIKLDDGSFLPYEEGKIILLTPTENLV